RPSHAPERPRVLLVVDADRAARERVGAALTSAGFEVRAAATRAEAADLLRDDVSLVLASQSLPPCELLSLLDDVRARSSVPGVIVRGPVTEASVAAAYDAGADDYVAEDAPTVELLGRVRGLIK